MKALIEMHFQSTDHWSGAIFSAHETLESPTIAPLTRYRDPSTIQLLKRSYRTSREG